jgi:hypothetical protein
MRFRFLLFTLVALALAFSPPLPAQSVAKTFTFTANSQTHCIGVTALPTVGIQVTGTFSLTLTPQVSINGQSPQSAQVTPANSSTAQSTITAAGAYVAGVGGYDTFCLSTTAYSSGTATVQLNPSPAVNASVLGSGSGSSAFSALTSSTNTGCSGCVVGSGAVFSPTGGGQLTANSEFLSNTALTTTPSPLTTGDCEPNTNPYGFDQDSGGTWRQAAGINTNVGFNGYSPAFGMTEFCRPVIFNATGGQVPQSSGLNSSPMTANGSLLIYGNPAFSTLASQIQVANLSTDTATYSGEWEGMYSEVDVYGDPVLEGNSPAGQQNSAFRGNWSDRSSNATNGAQGSAFSGLWGRLSSSSNNSGQVYYAYGGNLVTGTSTFSGAITDYYASGGDFGSGGNDTGVFNSFYANGPSTGFSGGQYAFRSNNFPNSAYFLFNSDADNSYLGTGPVYLSQLTPVSGNLSFTGSLSMTGGIAATQLSNPTGGGITQGGTPGLTSYSYAYTASDANGTTTIGTTAHTTSTGNATLSATNYNNIGIAQVAGAKLYTIYRTASSGTPSSTGVIGTVSNANLVSLPLSASFSFQDTGLAGDSTTAPTTNTTGGASFPGGVSNVPNLLFSTAQTGVSMTSGTGDIGSATTMVSSPSTASYTFTVQLIQTTPGASGTCSTGTVAIYLDYADPDSGVTIGTHTSYVTFFALNSNTAVDGATMTSAANGVVNNYVSVPRTFRAASGTAIKYEVYQVSGSNCTTPPVFAVRPALYSAGY